MVDQDQEGQRTITAGSGGLVTALGPVIRDRGGQWIGWLGSNLQGAPDEAALEELLDQGSRESGYSLKPVELSEEEIQKYYFGFSNEILWPLFHDLPSRCNFDPAYWKVYEQVNDKFARAVAAYTSEDEDYVWVQDYQLILVAASLKKMGVKRHTGFFLHIPFPPLDGFVRLPWRFQILNALLQYDLVGFWSTPSISRGSPMPSIRPAPWMRPAVIPAWRRCGAPSKSTTFSTGSTPFCAPASTRISTNFRRPNFSCPNLNRRKSEHRALSPVRSFFSALGNRDQSLFCTKKARPSAFPSP